MEIIHVSAECYPVAKAGGLGDVVGALPKYQNKLGHIAKVVMPMYRTKFLYENSWEVTHKGTGNLGTWTFPYTVIKETNNKLGFDLYLVDINGLLDREKIYGYNDDTERFTAFQIAVVDWIASWNHRPGIVHVHDYHTAFIPFMLKYCYMYQHLGSIPTVLTIHNAQYQGWMGWDKSHFIPHWDGWRWGLLDWKDTINPLATGIRSASMITTVSWSYLDELRYMSNGLEPLFEYERGKCVGILNGIDTKVWDPESDTYLDHHFSAETAAEGKLANKKILCDTFHLDINKPLIVFIGRLVGEKAADLLPQAIGEALYHINGRMNFLVLGSGEPWIEYQLESMRGLLAGQYNAQIGYDEKLSHIMYAGADFLLMPSRVEPCGLNQMYAMRYGTVPIVRSTGGLRDTVVDYGAPGGYGVCFTFDTVGEITNAIYRAVQLYNDRERMYAIRKQIMGLDFSWDRSAQQYLDLYANISPQQLENMGMKIGRAAVDAADQQTGISYAMPMMEDEEVITNDVVADAGDAGSGDLDATDQQASLSDVMPMVEDEEVITDDAAGDSGDAGTGNLDAADQQTGISYAMPMVEDKEVITNVVVADAVDAGTNESDTTAGTPQDVPRAGEPDSLPDEVAPEVSLPEGNDDAAFYNGIEEPLSGPADNITAATTSEDDGQKAAAMGHS